LVSDRCTSFGDEGCPAFESSE